MNKIVVKPFVKKSSKKANHKNRFKKLHISQFVSGSLLIKCICAFLLSGTSLIGSVTPLGFSFFASLIGSKDAYICACVAILGMVLRGVGFVSVGKYVIAMMIFSLAYDKFFPKTKKSNKNAAAIAGLSVAVSGLFLLFATMTIGGYPLIYDIVVLIVESATVWLATVAFSIAVPIIFSLKIRRALSAEETASLAFFVGGAICGLGNAGLPGVFSLTGILCVLSVLAFASGFGSLHGCCAGIIMGIICCVSKGRIDACAASFAFSGLCAGYFSIHGRWASCISFIMANAIITVLSNGSTEVLINISDTVIAAVLLYCMPKKIYDAITNIASKVHPATELTSYQLQFAGQTIQKCEKSFRKISEIRNNSDLNKIVLYKRTAKRVCSNCGLRKYCWGRDANATKEAMDLLSDMMKNAVAITQENAPAHCLRGEQFVNEFRKMYDVYKNDCIWTAKITEFQTGVYNSFKGISKLIDAVGMKAVNIQECDEVSADDIKARLKKEGIIAKNVFVSGNGDDTQIRIQLENCGGFGRCENAIYKVLMQSCGKSFVRTGLRCCGECMCRYVVKPEFSIVAATQGAIKANRKNSGDYAIYALVDRETYAIILCDGMGSGEIAKEESKTCASLLMRLLETGLDPQSALNIINSMLICASSGTLAAIDLCLISLKDGSSHLYKCGSASTYTKTESEVTHIDAKTLPIGSTALSDTNIYSIPSKKGSMIVLVSDGVTDTENEKLPWIKNTIQDYDGKEPETLAQMILQQVKNNSPKGIKDDVTVVAAYIG